MRTTYTFQSRPRLSLLGSFDLVVGGTSIDLTPASERLLAFIALHDRSLRRGFVSGSLWPDATSERANANLRSSLWRIPSADLEPVVAASATCLRLSPGLDVDYREATRCAESLLHPGRVDGPPDRFDLLYADLLPDWYEDWVVVERERHRQLRLHALDLACNRLIELGRYGEALEIALNEVASEPLRESGFRLLVRIHLAEGNLAEAIRQYRTYARLLELELGARPSESMRRLLDGHLLDASTAS